MTSPPSDTLDLVVRRADLLGELRDGPRTKPELVAGLAVSRSTVDRAVRTLESRGLVERRGGVSLTLRGRLALESHETFADSVSALRDAESALEPLPAAATIAPELLAGATVENPDRDAPQRATTSFLAEVERAEAIRGFPSAVLPPTVDVFHERIVDHGATVDLTVPESVLDELLASHSDRVHEALDSGRFTLREATTELSYSLLLVEQPARTVATALVYGDHGLAAVVKNDTEDAVAWTEDVYADLREDANPLPT
ncbi:helix-turn-helix transcriptional regulator [Halobacterium litoreum]|uniref:Helix-turn-helix transcriptional regulator n=1 Tax=Halobacterium litoreum TaxID=2039234 RepID=A0ABD5NI07_9EURY|nr:MarR family transcriptional regulator [Halobacterium litoreum]UHH12328.1 MarR family transcriptional regulator [Halobacterium litoreum]